MSLKPLEVRVPITELLTLAKKKNQNRHTQTTNPNQAESLMGDAIETGSRRNGEKRVVGFL